MTKTIGILGLGSIGTRHARNLIGLGCKVHGHDPNDDIDDVVGGLVFHAEPETMWFQVDAAIIASHTMLHLEHIQATEGKPTFVEKPIAHVLPPRVDHIVAVGNNLRFHSCVKKAKLWLKDKLIGFPIWAEFTVAQYNKKYTEDVILNYGAHELDLARYLLGEGLVVAAHGNKDIANVIIQHLGNDCRTSIHLDYLTEPEVRGFSIAGTEGVMHVDLVARKAVLQTKDGGEESYEAHDNWDGNYREEMRHFIDVLDGKPSALLATGQDGVACLEMILKAKELAGIQ